MNNKLTLPDLISDKIAEFGGSWAFILSFLFFMGIWIGFNVYAISYAFDPAPFILLNLILSCLAALQAPIIMMSQNRKEIRDREMVAKGVSVTIASEKELRQVHKEILEILTELKQMQKTELDLKKESSKLSKLIGEKKNEK